LPLADELGDAEEVPLAAADLLAALTTPEALLPAEAPADEPLPPTEEPLPPAEEPLPPADKPLPPADEPLPVGLAAPDDWGTAFAVILGVVTVSP